MIASPFIAEWSQFVSWAAVEQVEQDLTLSRLIVEIANDDFLGNELVFRGGTCLHKLHLPPGLRYSEDLDYVRRSAGGIREMVDALRSMGERLGMRVNVDVTKFPRVRFRAPFESGTGVMRIKIEINTYERSPARPLIHVPFAVESQWFHGSAMVQTFEVAELVSTKLRALYQRSKGRDLFDLWLALTRLAIPPTEILTCFEPYRPERYTKSLAVANLRAKLNSTDFRRDLDLLVSTRPLDYDMDSAARLVTDELLNRLE